MQYSRQFWIVSFVLLCFLGFQTCTAFIQRLSSVEARCPDKCSCSSHLKRVSCIGLNLRSVPSDIPLSVTELYLSKNLLTEIGRGTFQNLTSLSILSLEYNLIQDISGGAFLGLNNLTMLYLRHNKLAALLPEAFQDLDSLRHIYLTDNHLTRVPDVRYAPSLIHILLDYNKLDSAHVPDGFRNLTHLSTFVLSNNKELTQINDGDFEALNHSTIRKIAVSRCSLTHIGKNVFKFPHLQSLVLSYNTNWNQSFLRDVLSLLTSCSELTSLDLSGVISLGNLPADIFSSLASVPVKNLNLAHTTKVAVIDDKTFQYFPALEILDLSNSEFNVINDDMSEMKKLKSLKLRQNKQLKLVPALKLPALQTLDISLCTGLGELKQSIFFELPLLSKLIIRGCAIHRVYEDTFLGLTQLQMLDLSKNAFGSSSLPVTLFDPLTQLRKLDLSGNKLTQIQTESLLFRGLKALTVLDFSDNQCSVIHEDIFKPLSSLVSLDLSGNSLGGGTISAVAGGKLFRGLRALEIVTLTGNNIKDLPKGLFDGLLSLRMVNLSHNQLSGWNGSAFSASANLSLLDFTANKITAVPLSSIIPLAAQVELNLSVNPFACWCDLIWFRNWITDNNVTDRKLPGLPSYRCSSPDLMYNKVLLDFDPQSIADKCSPPPWIIITASAASGAALLIIILVTICYRYRWPIRLKFYRARKRMRGEPGYRRLDEATDDDYDVYVSYGPSADDEDWVMRTLMPVIDARERQREARPLRDALNIDAGADETSAEIPRAAAAFRAVRAYWEKRDMDPGTSEIGEIAEAINASFKVLLIVSTEYLNDGRRDFEMRLAIDKSCRAHRQLADIAVVLLDPGAAVKLPAALDSKLDEALEWTPNDANGQQLFWQKLEDFLHADIPHQPLPNA